MGLVLSDPVAAAAGDGTPRIAEWGTAASRNDCATGWLKCTRTVFSFTASTLVITRTVGGSIDWSAAIARVHASFTAAALNGLPSENFTPSRSVSSAVDGSVAVHFVARPGEPFLSGVSWIITS